MDDIYSTQRERSSLSILPRRQLTLSQVYAVATSARSKLRKEADKSEYDLRRLVAHANILDLAMEDLRGSVALDELCDVSHEQEERALHLLEVETEMSSRAVLSEEESIDDLEADACDPELTLVRSPTPASHAATTCHQNGDDPSVVHIPTSDLIQRLVIASILDDIEKELSDEGSDDDEGPVADDTSSSLPNRHQSSHTGPLFAQSPFLPPVKTTANLVVSRPKPLKPRIHAAA